MDKSVQEPARKGLSPWIKAVFGLSLAFNLAVLGLVVGLMVSGGPHGRGGDGDPRRLAGPPATGAAFVRALPRSDQRALRRAMRQSLAEGPDAGDRGRLSADQVRDVLGSDPFDPVAFDALLAKGPRHLMDSLSTGRRLLVERVGQMSPDERSGYAERVVRELERKGGRRSRK